MHEHSLIAGDNETRYVIYGIRYGQVENGLYSALELRCYCTQQKLSKIECLRILADKSTYKICEQSLRTYKKERRRKVTCIISNLRFY